MENGWWKNLKPGDTFETVPVGFGVADGSLNEAMAELTKYRRAIRRENDDDKKLNIVFNDYMNCLMGDPIESTEKEIIDKAAEMGCEYYCMDAGWYDKGYWWDRVGEWKESPERFPNGMKSVCDYAKSKGLVMGLWLEIEVMGVECELAKHFLMIGLSAVMENAISIINVIYWILEIRKFENIAVKLQTV